MASIWDRNDGRSRQLDAGVTPLEHEHDRGASRAAPPRPGAEAALLVAARDGRRWLLLAGRARQVHVNGWPVAAGLRVLDHEDEIEVDGRGRWTFSAAGSGEPFRYALRPGVDAHCPRCHLPIEDGDMVVECRNSECALIHHQSETLACWREGGCAVCREPATTDTQEEG